MGCKDSYAREDTLPKMPVNQQLVLPRLDTNFFSPKSEKYKQAK
jgi:hypothetical protein